MKKGIFITATGTDVGKTFVSALLVKHLRQSGIRAGYFKPVLSGAYRKDEKLIPGDAEYVCSVSNLSNLPEELVSYVFEEPVSPHLAAQIEGRCIEKKIILNHFNKIGKGFDFVVVEGCGGILCPLRLDQEPLLVSDIIKMIGLDVVIVAPAGLGTINATVLTVEYARKSKIVIAGIVLNHYEKGNFLHEDNRKQIERLTGVPVIACVSENASNLELDLDFFLS